ncbi:hypothetical protein YC2023_085335 [Brassica napus]
MRARSLRSDRAWLVRGPIAILELARGRFDYVSIPLDNRINMISLQEVSGKEAEIVLIILRFGDGST